MKEKAVVEAEKRIKAYQKFQKKVAKKAEKEEKQLEKQRKKVSDVSNNDQKPKLHGTQSIMRKEPRAQMKSSLKFSDLVNSNSSSSGTTNKIKILGGVSRKVNLKKQHSDCVSTTSDFKVRDILSDDGTRSVRSLMGIRRDNEILYVPKFDSISQHESGSVNNLAVNRKHMKDVFNDSETLESKSGKQNETLYRALSEPDFMNHFEQESQGDGKLQNIETSIFSRPGFGSVSFRGRLTSQTLFCKTQSDESSGRRGSDKSSASYNDSIGSVGSLAQRTHNYTNHMLWDDDEFQQNHRETGCRINTMPIFLFLCAHGLTEYSSMFSLEKIDLESLMLLDEHDLRSLGLPLGPRRKILKAIQERKNALKNPGQVKDTAL